MILSGLVLGDGFLTALLGVRGLLGVAEGDGEGVHTAPSLQSGTSWAELGGVTKTTLHFGKVFPGDFLVGFTGDFPFLFVGLFRGLGFRCRCSLEGALKRNRNKILTALY